MLKRLFSTIVSVAFCLAVGAQGTCVINGNIDEVKAADGKKVKKVYLTRTDELGRMVTVAESKVKKGKYTFRYDLAKDEPVLLYTVTGFGKGKGIEVYVEPGEVAVSTVSAANPCVTTVTGTPTNDTYSEYKKIIEAGSNAAEICTDERMKSREAIKCLSQIIRFFIDHNASPMTPLEIERYLLHQLSPAYAEQMLNSISTSLYNHPYYLSLRNKVLAGNLKVGSEVPNVLLPMLGGETKQLNDFRGKYVVLNFWSSGCDKSAAMLEEMRNLYNVVKESEEQFVIISFALDSDKASWENAVKSSGTALGGWLHACDGAAVDSPAAKLLGVDKTPKILLVEPEGLAVSLDMDVDEVVMRVEQILSGDLYYLDQQE